MKNTIIVLIILGISLKSYSKEGNEKINTKFEKKNSIEFNLGGHGVFYSFGYERMIINRNRYKLSGKIDLAYYPYAWNIAQSLWIPLSLNHIISFNKHHIEFGSGILFSRDNVRSYSPYQDIWEKWGILSFGYRHQKKESRILYKILFTPIIEHNYEWTEIHPLIGGTIGYKF